MPTDSLSRRRGKDTPPERRDSELPPVSKAKGVPNLPPFGARRRISFPSIAAMLKAVGVGRLALASTRSLAGTSTPSGSIRPSMGGIGAWRWVADATALSRCTAASSSILTNLEASPSP